MQAEEPPERKPKTFGAQMSKRAADAQARAVAPGLDCRPRQWMWDREGLGLNKHGSGALRVFARAYAVARTGAVYFESASRAAKAVGMNRESAVTGRRRLVENGLLEEVGVKLVEDGHGNGSLERTAGGQGVNNQMGYTVDLVAAEKARAHWSRLNPGLDPDAPFAAPRAGQHTGSDATETMTTPCGCPTAQPQDIAGDRDTKAVQAGNRDTRACGGNARATQDTAVAQADASEHRFLANESNRSDTRGSDEKGSRRNTRRSSKTLKEVKEDERENPEPTPGEIGAYRALEEAWPGRKPSGELGRARAFRAWRGLIAKGVPAEAVALGASRYADWVKSRDEEARMSLAAFLEPSKGGMSSFVARAARDLRCGTAHRAESSPTGSDAPFDESDLVFAWQGDGRWTVSTPGGWSDTYYPSWPLNRPTADRAALVADYTQTHGTAWRTFKQVGAEELDFAWEADAAWGGCWVARVGGFRKALRGPAGVDRNASRSALVAEVNSSPSARAELACALSRGEGRVA